MVLLPLDHATFYRDTMGISQVSLDIAFSTSPEIVDRPPATAASGGFAILVPGTDQTGLWRLERVVGLTDSQSSKRPVLPPQFNAPPKVVPVEAIYRRIDQTVVIRVDEPNPGSDVHDLLAEYTCHELAISVSINADQEVFFDRLVPLTNKSVGPPCVPR